jgi:splicing factor U2AF 65 kDa subunit
LFCCSGSYDEERDWVEDRRRKRQTRAHRRFVATAPGAMVASLMRQSLAPPEVVDPSTSSYDPYSGNMESGASMMNSNPQQTRHARRLYVGNLPPYIGEMEVQTAFRQAIEVAWIDPPSKPIEDPILSVYINHERRFCFVEFRTVELTTACLQLDGLPLGSMKVKIKRPNDYNPAAAPSFPPSSLPTFDVSLLGIVSNTVPDGPFKVFIGGLPYHFQEAQVLELVSAFGKVRAFHLVKPTPDAELSKGYAFCEYVDATSVTMTAVQGLNGMDLGNGKTITARLAGERKDGMEGEMMGVMPAVPSMPNVGTTVALVAPPPGQPMAMPTPTEISPDRTIVAGYDIELLVDAAMGQAIMPTTPQYFDPATGLPLTRMALVSPALLSAAAAAAAAVQAAALGPSNNFAQLPPAHQALSAPAPPLETRILVLQNMVSDDDLALDDDYAALTEEVREECAKFGQLLSLKIPRPAQVDHARVHDSALRKIYLEYATAQDARNADRELAGRQFGNFVVQTTYYSEQDFAHGVLR